MVLKGTHCMHPAAPGTCPILATDAVGMAAHTTRPSCPPTNAPDGAVNGLTKSALEAIRASMALEELLLEVGVPIRGRPAHMVTSCVHNRGCKLAARACQ